MKTPNPFTNCSSFKRSAVLCLSLLISCLGLLPKAQAVSPPPDGGYPGANTAEGDAALLSLTPAGTFNTAVGFFALLSNTSGGFNTALGAGTLFLNTADSNTAVGAGALLSNTVGFGNTANGAFALFSNNGGVTNVANGYQALFSNSTGGSNTAIGTGALFSAYASATVHARILAICWTRIGFEKLIY